MHTSHRPMGQLRPQIRISRGFYEIWSRHLEIGYGPAFFTCAPTRLARLAFYCEKLIFLKKVGVATYFISIFEGKIKQEIKP